MAGSNATPTGAVSETSPTGGVPETTPTPAVPEVTPTAAVPEATPTAQAPEATPTWEVAKEVQVVEVPMAVTVERSGGPSFRYCGWTYFDWGPRYDYDQVAWSPGGSKVYFTDGQDLYGVTADGSRLWLIATVGLPDGYRGGGGERAPSFAVSPDGSHLVYASCRYPRAYSPEFRDAGGGTFELARVAVDGRNVERLTVNEAVDHYPAWSPDGRRIAYVSDAKLLANVLDAALADPPRAQPPPQLRSDASAMRVGLFTMAADGTDIRPVLDDDFAVLHQPPAWSPDGRHLAVVRYLEEGVGGRSAITDIGRQLYVVGAGGVEPRLLADNVVSGPSWSPDGQRLAIAQAEEDGVGLYVIGIDGTESRRVTDIEGWRSPFWRAKRSPPDPAEAWIDTVVWSPDGTRILVRSNFEQAAFAVNVETGRKTFVGNVGYQPDRVFSIGSWGEVRAVASSPGDRHRAVVLNFEEGVGRFSTITDVGRELYVLVGNAEPRRVAVNVVSGPSWSPDGQRLAIAQADVDGVGLYVIGIDGTESRRVTGIDVWPEPAPFSGAPTRVSDLAEVWIDTVVWSPDGTQILVRSSVEQAAFAVSVETGRKTFVGDIGYQPDPVFQHVRAAAWSPDGSRIAMISGGGARKGLYIVWTMAADGTDIRVLAKRNFHGILHPQQVCRAEDARPSPDTNVALVADCAALLDFKHSLAGGLELNWGGERPVERWDGVEVGGTPLRVQALNLSDHRLRGALPAALGRLSHLRTLVLRDNSLDGPIPPELGQLSRLEVLDLSNNRLTGPIPAALGNLVNLRTLDLEANGLSGDIPPELGQLTDLEEIALGGNRFTGCVPPELPVDDAASLSLPACEPAA